MNRWNWVLAPPSDFRNSVLLSFHSFTGWIHLSDFFYVLVSVFGEFPLSCFHFLTFLLGNGFCRFDLYVFSFLFRVPDFNALRISFFVLS